MTIDRTSESVQRIESMTARAVGGNYVTHRQVGSLVYLSGQISMRPDGTLYSGQIGVDLSVLEGYEAAQVCMENLFVALLAGLQGDWDRIVSCVRLTGYVNSQAPFADGPKVINGASDLVVEVLGPVAGQHARSAVGVSALPRNAAVEVEAIFEVREPITSA